jgi:hypothetical protein
MGNFDEERENMHGHYHGHDWPALRIFKAIGIAIGGLAMAVVLGFLFGWFVMKLWNWVMPDIFGLKMITYWQAFGLVVLAKILFGGTRHAYGHHHRDHGEKMMRLKAWKHMRGRMGSQWAPGGEYSNWRYYEDYWNSEGKAAYEAYLNRIKEEKKS